MSNEMSTRHQSVICGLLLKWQPLDKRPNFNLPRAGVSNIKDIYVCGLANQFRQAVEPCCFQVITVSTSEEDRVSSFYSHYSKYTLCSIKHCLSDVSGVYTFFPFIVQRLED